MDHFLNRSCSIAGPPDDTTIAGVATSIALFIGWAPQGPLDRALRIAGFSDYQRSYDSLDAGSLLGSAIRQFYDNGGVDAYVLRLVGDRDAAFFEALKAAFEEGGAATQIDLFNLICVPGLADVPAVRLLQQRARERRAFLIVDAAEDADARRSNSRPLRSPVRMRPTAALYFPVGTGA